MGIRERSRERIEAYIAGLEETYGTFPVNQTTVSLPDERYDSMREREAGGFVEAYIQVHNDESDVLHLEKGGDPDLPGVRVSLGERLESHVRETVRDEAGVGCAVQDVRRATIAGIRSAGNPDAGSIYSLVVVFAGIHTEGVPADDAGWYPSAGPIQPLRA